jgi:hypothetical protein
MAAVCNAVMDMVENENFSSSVFSKLNPRWWYKRESWKWARKVFGWKFDAWHLFKSVMIIFISLSMVYYTPIIGNLLDIIIYGVVWNAIFILFYHKILRK